MREACNLEAPFCASLVHGDGRACLHRSECQCYRDGHCPFPKGKKRPTVSKCRPLNAVDLSCLPRRFNCHLFKSVEALAEDYLRKAGVEGPPVPSELVTIFDPNRKVEVRYVPLKVYHGGAWLLGEEWVIHLNARAPRRVKRYTLFHEAFHIVSRTVCPSFSKLDLNYRPINELLADYFSICILMPKQWVKEYWAKTGSVQRMSQIFDVPESALRKRLRQLSLTE